MAFSRCRKDPYSRLESGQQVLVSSVAVHTVEESHTGSAVCRLPGGHWHTLELCENQELNKAILGSHVHCYHVAVLGSPGSQRLPGCSESTWAMVSLGQFRNEPPAEAGR
ncbi:hypothetical protein MRX96_021802 [Rhipicephalus microplus]